MATSNIGRFCWYELLTRDVEAATAFYGDVVGWKTQPFAEGGHTAYRLWLTAAGPIGGVMSIAESAPHCPDPAKAAALPPHWFAHVLVEDVDATCKQARALDGKILVGPMDIPNIGRFATIGDPQGASLCVFTPKPGSQQMPAHDDRKPGEIAWHELVTTSQTAALDFYAKLFGWKKKQEMPLGPMGTYWIYGTADKDLGGIFSPPKEMAKEPPSWRYYIHVDDVDAAVERAKSKGAKLTHGPIDVPGGDRVASLVDPQGAHFHLHASKK